MEILSKWRHNFFFFYSTRSYILKYKNDSLKSVWKCKCKSAFYPIFLLSLQDSFAWSSMAAMLVYCSSGLKQSVLCIHARAGLYINCPFIPTVVKKARKVHIIKQWVVAKKIWQQGSESRRFRGAQKQPGECQEKGWSWSAGSECKHTVWAKAVKI